MTKRRRVWSLVTALVVAGLAALTACGGTGAGGPTVTIVSPAAGSTVPVGELLSVELSASDPDGPGVTRLELQVGDGQTEVYEAGGPQPSITTSMLCTPTEEGPTTLTVIAYRADGTASSPATISLSVAPGSGPGGAPSGAETTTDTDEMPPAQVVPAQANLNTNVRMGPMPDCQIIGSVDQDTVVQVSAVTDRSVDNWYRIEDPLGWIWEGNLTLLEDDSSLPRLNVTTCEAGGAVAGAGTGAGTGTGDAGGSGGVTAVCGDGTCSGGETCETCEDDCGPCVAAPVCGDGTCSAEAGETCETCEDDCGPCTVTFGDPVPCGDGTCSAEDDETCETCEVDCGPCTVTFGDPVEECGDGICSGGEDEQTCYEDCGCGDGYCLTVLEDCVSCAVDCGACAGEPACGNGALDPGEECETYEQCGGFSSCLVPGCYCIPPGGHVPEGAEAR